MEWQFKLNKVTFPKQENSYDCDVFIMAGAFLLISNNYLTFTQIKINHRKKILNSILKGNLQELQIDFYKLVSFLVITLPSFIK